MKSKIGINYYVKSTSGREIHFKLILIHVLMFPQFLTAQFIGNQKDFMVSRVTLQIEKLIFFNIFFYSCKTDVFAFQITEAIEFWCMLISSFK